MDELLKKINELKGRLDETWRFLKIEKQIEESTRLKQAMNQKDFWQDKDRAVEISKKVEELDTEINTRQDFKNELTDLEELVEVSLKENDTSIEKEAQKRYDDLRKRYEKLEFFVLFSGKYDKSQAILSIHAGTGGVDAQDWAEMLMRMYLRFAENKNWKTEIVDYSAGNEAGIKSVTISITGRWAYGHLKSEAGVHRLVRISPFDAESMRHTSFALVEVIPELPAEEEIEIKDEDLKIDTYRSSGAGGQHVNKTDSAVRITHLPTKIVVACQNQRSQHQNKETALKILKSKLHKLQIEKKEKEETTLRGEAQQAVWGKQIRSYVLQPYKMAKDHRTNFETSDVESVLDGNLAGFIEAYLKMKSS